MRVSREEKDQSHQRIVASAAKLFREHGLEGTSVGDVMKSAGLTHGGFYKHFESKDALIEAALERAFAEFVPLLQQAEEARSFDAYRARYLSREHKEHPALGCPVAALGTEIARGPAALKRAFGAGVRRMVHAIAASRKGSAAIRRTAALRECSMLVGAMVIARASDPELAEDIFAACRREPAGVSVATNHG